MRLALISAAVFSACAAGGPDQTPFPFARAHLECGPADGPAIRIQLARTALPKAVREQPAVPYLDVLVNGSITDLRGRSLAIDREGRGPTGTSHARHCDDHGCATVETGHIRLDTLDDSTLTGRFNFQLPDRSRLAGRFSARWIDVPLLCG